MLHMCCKIWVVMYGWAGHGECVLRQRGVFKLDTAACCIAYVLVFPFCAYDKKKNVHLIKR